MIVASAGRGDDAPFRRDGTDVRRGVMALVAIGDGADAERAHGVCRSSGRRLLPHEVGGRTRRRAMAIVIAMVMVIVTSGRGGVDVQADAAEGDGGVKLDGTAGTYAAARRAPVDGAQRRDRRDAEAAAGDDAASTAGAADSAIAMTTDASARRVVRAG